ncbi:MAG: hypothetical protein V3S49_04940 [Thermodesulfobacteriota bacterium]
MSYKKLEKQLGVSATVLHRHIFYGSVMKPVNAIKVEAKTGKKVKALQLMIMTASRSGLGDC